MKRNSKNKRSLGALLLAACLLFTGCSSAATTLAAKEPVTATVGEQNAVPCINNTQKFNGKTLYEYYSQNQDTIGWLTIPGIKTDNIVMMGQKKEYDKGTDGVHHYLNYTFEHTYSSAGELYIYYRDDISYDSICQNITVYGHHMKDGTMLAGLDSYKQESYFKDHQYLTFHTLWNTYHYRVFGIFVVNLKVQADKDFEFRQADYEDQKEFLAFIDEVKERSMYDTGVEVKENDRIINLVTCTYPTGRPGYDNARLVLMARLCTDEAEIAAAEKALTE